MKIQSAYDEIAAMYHALWADWYVPAAQPALERLFFSRIPPRASVLDLCCGSGHVTCELIRRGYVVSGIDSSAGLIALARRDLPSATFLVQDARCLKFDQCFHGVLSTFDSLNHLMSLSDLQTVFDRVHRALKPGGLFVFDMNLEEAYLADLRQWNVSMSGDAVGLMRGSYNPETRKAITELIWFERTGDLWARHESMVEERCYPQSEIALALAQSGFKYIESISATDAGMRADVGLGRVFFLAERPV